MKHNIKYINLILALSSFAYANGNTPLVSESLTPEGQLLSFEDDAFYVGVGASRMEISNRFTDEAMTMVSTTLKVGYEYNRYLAVEGRYTTSTGQVDYVSGSQNIGYDMDDYPTDISNIAIYINNRYEIKDFAIYALIGYGETTITNVPIGNPDDQVSDGVQMGLGADYAITEDAFVFVDYVMMYDKLGFDGKAIDNAVRIESVSFGLNYKF